MQRKNTKINLFGKPPKFIKLLTGKWPFDNETSDDMFLCVQQTHLRKEVFLKFLNNCDIIYFLLYWKQLKLKRKEKLFRPIKFDWIDLNTFII